MRPTENSVAGRASTKKVSALERVTIKPLSFTLFYHWLTQAQDVQQKRRARPAWAAGRVGSCTAVRKAELWWSTAAIPVPADVTPVGECGAAAELNSPAVAPSVLRVRRRTEVCVCVCVCVCVLSLIHI